ncbi:hypothetical protein C8J56DRAFT_1052921 [Mycena floridula]|nr:hypothetical protein C8J56DRAFT_1052921 [Mycena floridula]
MDSTSSGLVQQTKPIFPNLDRLSIIIKDQLDLLFGPSAFRLQLPIGALRDLQRFRARGIDISLHLDATQESACIVDEIDLDNESDEEISEI